LFQMVRNDTRNSSSGSKKSTNIRLAFQIIMYASIQMKTCVDEHWKWPDFEHLKWPENGHLVPGVQNTGRLPDNRQSET